MNIVGHLPTPEHQNQSSSAVKLSGMPDLLDAKENTSLPSSNEQSATTPQTQRSHVQPVQSPEPNEAPLEAPQPATLTSDQTALTSSATVSSSAPFVSPPDVNQAVSEPEIRTRPLNIPTHLTSQNEVKVERQITSLEGPSRRVTAETINNQLRAPPPYQQFQTPMAFPQPFSTPCQSLSAAPQLWPQSITPCHCPRMVFPPHPPPHHPHHYHHPHDHSPFSPRHHHHPHHSPPPVLNCSLSLSFSLLPPRPPPPDPFHAFMAPPHPPLQRFPATRPPCQSMTPPCLPTAHHRPPMPPPPMATRPPASPPCFPRHPCCPPMIYPTAFSESHAYRPHLPMCSCYRPPLPALPSAAQPLPMHSHGQPYFTGYPPTELQFQWPLPGCCRSQLLAQAVPPAPLPHQSQHHEQPNHSAVSLSETAEPRGTAAAQEEDPYPFPRIITNDSRKLQFPLLPPQSANSELPPLQYSSPSATGWPSYSSPNYYLYDFYWPTQFDFQEPYLQAPVAFYEMGVGHPYPQMAPMAMSDQASPMLASQQASARLLKQTTGNTTAIRGTNSDINDKRASPAARAATLSRPSDLPHSPTKSPPSRSSSCPPDRSPSV